MKKPVLSLNFTIEDIHKLREYNYEITKNMAKWEKMNYYNNKGKDINNLRVFHIIPPKEGLTVNKIVKRLCIYCNSLFYLRII